MALFAREKATVPELIARKKYREALEGLKEQLKLRPGDKSLRLQSAEVLVLIGKIDVATRVLGSVADDFAAEGFAAKSVAVLKKIQRLEPDRKDVESRLVQIFKKSAPPRLALAEELDRRLPPPTGAGVSREGTPAEFPAAEDLDIGFVAGSIPDLPADMELRGAVTLETDLRLFEQPATREEGRPVRRVASPLFDDFADAEMIEFIRGLELLSFEPGDIIVTEGEAGDSLYVITTGVVKAFVRNPEGANTQVRQLGEGAFFGEISVLSGLPRTATITAATPCELLRLDRATLDDISRRKPGVREVLRRFYDERVSNTAEMEIRGIEVGTGATARRAGLTGDEGDPVLQEPPHQAGPAEARILNLREVALAHTRKLRWADAVTAWQHYLAVRPSDAEATNVLGVLFCRLGRWQDAAETFTEAVRLDRDDATAFYNLGLALTHLEQIPSAVEAYRHALQIQPEHEKAKHNLSALYQRLKRESAVV